MSPHKPTERRVTPGATQTTGEGGERAQRGGLADSRGPDEITAAEYVAMQAKAKGENKFGAQATVVDGIRFDSKLEALRYQQLKLFEAAGAISLLTCQPKFDLHVSGQKVGYYKADFWYFDRIEQHWVVEDVKSKPTATPIYKLKKKMVAAEYDVTIKEITREMMG